MLIKLELESITNALDTITKVAPPTSGNVTLIAAKGKLTLTSSGDISRCSIIVPSEVEGELDIAVPIQALKDAVKGRAKIELGFANSTLVVKSGAYKAELATVDVIPWDDQNPEETKEWKLEAAQAAWLKKSLRDVQLKPTSILSSWMPAGIKLTDKGAFVACYDTQHMSWATTKEVTGEFECVMPIETMLNLVDVFHKSNFVILQGKTRILVKNKLVTVQLSLPATDDMPSIEDVQAKIKEAAKIDGQIFKFQKAGFLTFLDNAKSVMGKDRAEILVSYGKGVELLIKTGQGQVKNVIKGAGSGKFSIDFEYMQELVGKAPEVVELKVVGDAFLSSKLTSSTLIVALNQ